MAETFMASFIPIHYYYLFLFLSLPFVSGHIETGSSLVAGDPSSSTWKSPFGDFAFGFRKLLGSDGFLLAVWFAKTPENTIVWFPKGDVNDDAVSAGRGFKLELSGSNGLVLRNGEGEEKWRSELCFGCVVSYASMEDSGNFVLFDDNQTPLWETFGNPTDTLLPTQVMLINGVLSSRISKESFSHGRFQFRMLKDGNVVLNTVNVRTRFPYDAYYISGTRNEANMLESGYNVIFSEDGSLSVMQRNGKRVHIINPPSGFPPSTYYFRATLNFDGVLTVSCHPKSPKATTNGSWKDVATIPENICTAAHGVLGTGACGFNSICRLNPDHRPSCQCPPGYSLIDPKDKYGSCRPNFTESCNDDGRIYSMMELRNTDWPMLDYELYRPFGVEECKNECLNDWLCVVAVYRDNTCWKKKLPLSNGREDPTETSVSFLKLRLKRNI